MRTCLAIILTTIVGTAAGLGMALLRIAWVPWEKEAAPAETAKVVVDQTQFNFGDMDFDATGSHDFVFSNAGTVPLELALGAKSCQCTDASIEHAQVAPGDSTKVTMQWKPKETAGPYRQTATIRTNDRARPEVTLTVSGRINVPLRAVPAELSFGGVSADEGAAGEVRLLCYLAKPLEILGYTFSDKALGEHFALKFEPLPAAQLREEPAARSGKLMTVTVKPGLPHGQFHPRILIRTNLDSATAIDVPIRLTVLSDIDIVGPRDVWDPQTRVLSFGTVRSEEGRQRRLWLRVRGPYRQQVQLKSVVDLPDMLKVTLGDPQPINEGAVFRIPLIIEVPKGTSHTTHLGGEQGSFGEITIETNHPKLPKLSIHASFRVEE